MSEFVSKLHWLWILQVIYLSIKNSSYFFGLSKLFRSYFFYCFFTTFFNFFFIFLYKKFFEISCFRFNKDFVYFVIFIF